MGTDEATANLGWQLSWPQLAILSSGCGLIVGGGKRDRTADLLHAMQALSQLSYTPTANMKL